MNKFLRSTPYYQRKQRLRLTDEELAQYLHDLTAIVDASDLDADEFRQKQAIAFEKLKQMNRPAVPHLLPILNHPLAQDLIRNFGFYATEVLTESLEMYPEHTEHAFKLLTEFGDERAYRTARRYLNHENPSVQRFASQIVEKYRNTPNLGEAVVDGLRTLMRRFGVTIW